MTANGANFDDGDDGNGPGGQGAGATARKVAGEAAFALAKACAVEAVETVVEIMRSPRRNSAARLAAATKLLDMAGVGAVAEDRRAVELLQELKGKLSVEAHREVLEALWKAMDLQR